MGKTKQREEFEAWVMRVNPGCVLTKRIDGSYTSSWAKRNFDVWQAAQKAALASIEIDIKQIDEHQLCEYGVGKNFAHGYINGRLSVIKSMRDLGLKVRVKS